MKKVVYLTRNGLSEPLGQSQIYPYLALLSRDYEISLVSFERAHDGRMRDIISRCKVECKEHNIKWVMLVFRSKPRPWVQAIALLQLTVVTLRLRKSIKPDLIHARSYVPAAIALLINQLSGVPFIFDMRAIWPEELIVSGQIRRGGRLHQVLLWLERECVRSSSGIVSLTHAGVGYLKETYPEEMKSKRVVVIPTCADLKRFKNDRPRKSDKFVIGCVGTVLSGWFLIGWLRSFLDSLFRIRPDAWFQMTTKDSPEAILKVLEPDADWAGRIRIGEAQPADMPRVQMAQTASVMFFTAGRSKVGSCPTRMAEALGCGKPIVSNAGVGDVDSIIRKNGVGVIAAGPSAAEMDTCVMELIELLKDPMLARRCRITAEKEFSLERGVSTFRSLYRDIL